MKIAIHNRSGSFSDYWVKYCQKTGIEYKLVNAYDDDIVEQIKGYDVFMWHHHQSNYKDCLFAKQLLYSLQMAGVKVFPDFNTGWHFDDKVGQKYLLESIDAPLVPSYVFYTKEDALKWIENTTFPKVFKLRGGAGSHNVMLIRTKAEAIRYTKIAFGKGFSQTNLSHIISDDWRKYKLGKVTLFYILKDIAAYYLKQNSFRKMHSREKGYVYFQEFMEGNKYDTRLVVISGRYAFGEKRFVRENDFRASGSGCFSYNDIDEQIVRIAFDVAKKLKAQSVAFDFIYDNNHNPKIVEMSFGFGVHGVGNCHGYWTDDMEWHEGKGFDFCGWMVETVLK